ncbi:MAG TPA: hypothetical protein VHX15_22085 [Frankiaceae bacterium]|jgi:hypothetical protein|nr:hypothetical protein [Frankiaceae bacterium]
MRDIAAVRPESDFVVEVLLDRPPLVSVAHLRWKDGSETYEVVIANDAPEDAIARAQAEIPPDVLLLDSTQDVKHSPLGVVASIRTYGTL